MRPDQRGGHNRPHSLPHRSHAVSLSDIEIARQAHLQRISTLARERLGIDDQHLVPYGHYKAKLALPYLDSLQFVDYGIMAATFFNLETGKAFRIISTEQARDLAAVYAPEIAEKGPRQLVAYKRMPDSVLFRVQKVRVNIDECDLPGPTRRKIVCSICGQVIRDKRESMIEDRPLCRPCSGACYFTHAREVSWPDMNWSPGEPAQAKRINSDGDAGNRSLTLH